MDMMPARHRGAAATGGLRSNDHHQMSSRRGVINFITHEHRVAVQDVGHQRMSIGDFLGTAASIAFANAAEGLKRNGTLPKEVFG